MTTLAPNINDIEEPRAKKVWFESKTINIDLVDGRSFKVPLSHYPLLEKATLNQRKDYRIFGDGTAIHFNQLKEDLSVEALVFGRRQIALSPK